MRSASRQSPPGIELPAPLVNFLRGHANSETAAGRPARAMVRLGRRVRVRWLWPQAWRVPVVFVPLPAIAVMISRVTESLGGSHVFRLAQVAAKIEKFVRQGLSLRPSTYNDDVPSAAFDLRLYQLAATRRLWSPRPHARYYAVRHSE